MQRNNRPTRILMAAITSTIGLSAARADEPLRISEIFFDGPGTDVGGTPENPFAQIYIELRGTPNASLSNKYLIFLESEDNAESGNVDGVFNLSGMTIGSNGFLMLLPNGFSRPTAYVKKGTAIHQNNTGFGFGEGSGNSIYQSQGGIGDVENAGFSAFLLDKGIGLTPTIGQVLDSDRDAKLDLTPTAGWTLLDSVGQAEDSETTAFGYSKTFFTGNQISNINIATASIGGNTTNTNVIVKIPQTVNGAGVAMEPEHLFRYGSSTGNFASDWTAANITNNTLSGYSVASFPKNGYPVSADPHGLNPAQPGQIARGQANTNTYQTVGSTGPEAALIQNTMGRPNWPIKDGDLSQNEAIDQADLDIILSNWQVVNTNLRGYWLVGDAAGTIETISGVPTDVGGDSVVNKADLDFVMDAWPLRGTVGYTQPDFGFLAGDINLDGFVNLADLSLLAQKWGTNHVRTPTGLFGYEVGDYDYDGFVGITDLYAMSLNWESGFSEFAAAVQSAGIDTALVPEPAGMSLLLVTASSLLSRRRRTR